MGIGPRFRSFHDKPHKFRPQVCLAETNNLNKSIFKRKFLLGKNYVVADFEELLSSQKYWVRKLQICKAQKIEICKSQTRKLQQLRKVRYFQIFCKFTNLRICYLRNLFYYRPPFKLT
jgi:hypothetical protein